MKTAVVPSPLGEILLAAEGGALCGLWFAGQKYEGAGLPADVERISAAEDEILSRAARWLTAYFAGEAPALDFPLAPRGTVFQKRVWRVNKKSVFKNGKTRTESKKMGRRAHWNPVFKNGGGR